jgi:ADP-ribose pyrophosphatase
MPGRVRILKSQTLFRGRVIQLKVEQVVEPGGIETTREVVCHSGSVVVIPRLPDGRVLLVRQYRHAVRETLWELVAGGIEPGETPRQSAQRELQEETGYRARTLKLLLMFYPSPGILSEKMHLVEARGLSPAKSQPDPDERIELGLFAVPELLDMVKRNAIRDAKTLVGILWLFAGQGPGA